MKDKNAFASYLKGDEFGFQLLFFVLEFLCLCLERRKCLVIVSLFFFNCLHHLFRHFLALFDFGLV